MEEVQRWLQSIGLDRYAAKFEEEGWDTLEILCDMTPDEIERCIDKPGHRRKFVNGLKEKPPSVKEPGLDKARPNDTDKTTKDVLQDSTKSLELPKGHVAEYSSFDHFVTPTGTKGYIRATADGQQSKSLDYISVQTQTLVKPISNETQSKTEILPDTQSVDVSKVIETDICISNESKLIEHTGTENENAEIDISDIRQIERHNEIPQHTSHLDDKKEDRKTDSNLHVSCQETSELSDITLSSKFAGANAAIDTSRAAGKSFTMFDTEEENAGLDNSDKGQIENYENTHQTSDLDDKGEGREKDNKLHSQERPELSDVTSLSRFEGADAIIDTSRADGKSLAMVETENAEIDNSDIRQTERRYVNTQQTSDLDDKRKCREADIKLQVSCQETSELSDITTLSKFEGAEAAIGTSMADCESLQTVDTFYVGGAKNKIISTLLDGTQVDGRLCTRTYTGSSIAEGNLEHRYVSLR